MYTFKMTSEGFIKRISILIFKSNTHNEKSNIGTHWARLQKDIRIQHVKTLMMRTYFNTIEQF
jgi:hypothetical protein